MDRKNNKSVAAMHIDVGDGSLSGHLASMASGDENDLGSLPAVDTADHNEVVILIVGNKAQDKRGVVDSLMRSDEWDDRMANDVRILTSTSPARVIVDTTPLRTIPGRSPTAIARRWISLNSLRRIILGKDVVVVCVITSRVQATCQRDTFVCSYGNCWVDVFGLIFKQQKGAVMMLVNTEGEGTLSQSTTSEIERFVQDHDFPSKAITFTNLRGGDSVRGIIEAAIEESMSSRRARGWPRRRLNSSRLNSPRPNSPGPKMDSPRGRTDSRPSRHPPKHPMPFQIGGSLSDKDNFGPWGPERLILFGRAGSGKSTLAQMLTLGRLDSSNTTFVPSAGIRGGTKDIQPGIGRGWYVLDTPGFGEPRGDEATISTRDVEQKIKKYVKMVEGTFSHYLYVVAKDRLDILEERLWKFFMLLFGEDIKQQFSVVISGADEEWVERNLSTLKACFVGCNSFLCAEFPAIQGDDEELESEYQVMRTESLLALEEKLAKLNRTDMQCKYGRQSRMQLRLERDRARRDSGLERNPRIRFLERGATMIFACCNISRRPFAELTNLLTVDDSICLIPL